MESTSEKLMRSLADPNPLVVIVKAHLWIERSLNRMLEGDLARPEALQLDRLSFSQKLRLVEALDLIPQKHAETVRIINGVRNRAAHRLDWSLGDEDAKRVTDSIKTLGFKISDPEGPSTSNVILDGLFYLVGYMEGWADLRVWVGEHKAEVYTSQFLLAHFKEQGLTPREAAKRVAEFVHLDINKAYTDAYSRFEGDSK